MGKRWFYRVANLKNRKKIIKLRLTKKYYKSLYFTLSPRLKNNFYLLFLKFKSMHYYLLRYRQLLQKMLGNLNLKKLKKIYKKANINKNRMYLYNFISSLELRLSTALYHSFLIIQLNLIRFFISCNLIKVNNFFPNNFKYKIHPSDIVSLRTEKIYSSNHSSFIKYLRLHNKLNRFIIVKFFRLKLLKFIYFLKKKKIKDSFLKNKILIYNYTFFKKNFFCILCTKLNFLIINNLLSNIDLNNFYQKNISIFLLTYLFYSLFFKNSKKCVQYQFKSNALLNLIVL